MNGAIFWKGTNKDADVIVSFDIATEVFTLIPMPPSFSRLCVYDDKLAVISHTKAANIPNCPYSFLDLYVLEEGIGSSVKSSSWIKKCTCSPFPSHLLLGVMWKNQIVGVASATSQFLTEMKCEVEDAETKAGIYLFNITTNEFKFFTVPSRGETGFLLNYVESLVPLATATI